MEAIITIVQGLALGAAPIVGNEAVKCLVGDAYLALKDLVKKRYPKVSIEWLEQAPESKHRRAAIEEDLTAGGAAKDAELVAAARAVIELVKQHAPSAVSAVGIDLKDIVAGDLRANDIVASGTGVKVEGGTFTGDIEIRGVRAGIPPGKQV